MNITRNGRLPTIPEYYKAFINMNVDLTSAPKQPCPFHSETLPSFSYSADRGRWRCFGSCKCGGDVIDLHRKNYRLGSREEAERSLNSLYGIIKKPRMEQPNLDIEVNNDRVYQEQLYQEALILANTTDRWLELDYFMSKVPIEITDLKYIVDKWKENNV